MIEEKLTIRQIAALSGVSRSTVSRVLNEHSSVSAKTREQVLRVITETGFRPDPIARSLSSRRAGIIGLVIPLTIRSLFEDPFFPRLMRAFPEAAIATTRL
jgi:DNA-binding LacI/PurR family transcriptional regulator